MGTYNNNCQGCGCGPAIPEPCITPPPVCLDPQPCTEIINAQCVVYTGPAITCKDSPIIPTNSSLVEALEAIVDYICLGACCSIPAVIEIDNPDYIVLCTDSTATCAHVGKLYNWYTLNVGTAGNGRTAGGIVNINPLDNQINTWRVPNNNDWYALALALDPAATQTPWLNHAGGKIKSTTCWSLPNSGATNSSGLGVSPTVVRNATTGFFATNNGQNTVYWSGNDNTATAYAYGVDYLSDTISPYNPGSYRFGYKVRLVRPIDCNETDGDFISNAYKDNDGNLYNAEVIGNLVWLNSDLIDTKYNNAAPISNIIFDAPWIAATTGAWCYPNNSSTFTITYVDGCQQVKIAFENFLDFIPTSTQTFVVAAGAGIQVNSVVVGAQTTYTVTNTDPGSAVTLTSAGGIQTLVNDGMGPALAIKGLSPGVGIVLSPSPVDVMITNNDPGSAQFIFKNIAVATQPTVVADSNNDTLTFVAGAGISITTNSATDEITIINADPGSGVVLADAGTTAHESLVNDGNGPSLATKGLKAGTGITLSSTATDITIDGLDANVFTVVLPLIGNPVTLVHPFGAFASITVYYPKTGGFPYEVLVNGMDYAYSTNTGSLDIVPLSTKAESKTVFVKVIGS
jgi:uncharacterized protein (TIGR02145 family)